MPLSQNVMPKRTGFVLLETAEQQRNYAQLLVRLGYRYIIGWKDVRGWGISAVQFAEWQTPSSPPHINLR